VIYSSILSHKSAEWQQYKKFHFLMVLETLVTEFTYSALLGIPLMAVEG
jgi:hypothetical protein